MGLMPPKPGLAKMVAGVLALMAGACLSETKVSPAPPSVGPESTIQTRVAALLEPFDAGVPVVREVSFKQHVQFQERRFLVEADDEASIPVVRLRPREAGTRPAVLLVHGHDLSGEWWLSQDAGQLGLRLVELGYEVVLPDLRSFGGFAQLGHYGRDGWPQTLRKQGDYYVRVVANDVRKVLAILRADPKIGELSVMGQSLGAWIALIVTLVESDVSALVSSGLFLPFDVLFSSAHHDCQHFPAVAAFGDVDDWVAELLPRARVQIHWGENDPLFPNGGPEALKDLRSQAEMALENGRLEIRVTPRLGHKLDPDSHVSFLHRPE